MNLREMNVVDCFGQSVGDSIERRSCEFAARGSTKKVFALAKDARTDSESEY